MSVFASEVVRVIALSTSKYVMENKSTITQLKGTLQMTKKVLSFIFLYQVVQLYNCDEEEIVEL